MGQQNEDSISIKSFKDSMRWWVVHLALVRIIIMNPDRHFSVTELRDITGYDRSRTITSHLRQSNDVAQAKPSIFYYSKRNDELLPLLCKWMVGDAKSEDYIRFFIENITSVTQDQRLSPEEQYHYKRLLRYGKEQTWIILSRALSREVLKVTKRIEKAEAYKDVLQRFASADGS